MKIIDAGHFYELQNIEKDGVSSFQRLQFIKKEQNGPGDTELGIVTIGTTNEEVLRVLIDRLQFLNTAFPCRENSIVITKLEESLMWLEKRTADRISRGVEGKNEK